MTKTRDKKKVVIEQFILLLQESMEAADVPRLTVEQQEVLAAMLDTFLERAEPEPAPPAQGSLKAKKTTWH